MKKIQLPTVEQTKTQVKRAVPYAALIIFFGSLLFSYSKYVFERPGHRYVMYFESLDDRLCTEARFLKRKPVQGREHLFVDELLLGPLTNRYRPLFAPGTKAEFCFVRGKTMYVGLSKDAVQISAKSVDIKKGMELFKENILRNFTNIDTIV